MEVIETFYSSDLISRDFLSLCKKYVGGRHFRTDGKFQQANSACLHDHDADFDRLVYGWNKCFGKYSVKQYVPVPYYVVYHFELFLSKSFLLECLLPHF
ncbi:hypothetical protein AVEN_21723-1 [Araneus ventricosus]|uniref:Uncharacterized protein n=1 Tax=Araneus ventricosus TaxID=182803 RepID=A0A4Y2QWT5_ARAVE|nr:hypothetical protein AVEN_21723-1 [Araneus ventricosus]